MRVGALAVLVVGLSTSAAAAQCRPALAGDAEQMSGWDPIPGVGAVGECDVDGGEAQESGADQGYCFSVGTLVCPSAVYGTDPPETSVLRLGTATVLVLHWSLDHGGSVYYGGEVTEVWRVSGTPSFLFSVTSSYNEGEASMDGDDREVCSAERSVRVDESGVALGRRTTHGRCRGAFDRDRRGAARLSAAAAHWTWPQLGVAAPSPATP